MKKLIYRLLTLFFFIVWVVCGMLGTNVLATFSERNYFLVVVSTIFCALYHITSAKKRGFITGQKVGWWDYIISFSLCTTSMWVLYM